MRKLFVALLFLPFAAFAQNNRSAVSLNGSDTNPCTPAAPCRSFATAMSQTNDGGEIIAVDSAGYGPFSIDRSVTVTAAPGAHAAITVTSGIGINVLNGSGGRHVLIRNLVLIGNGGDTGIATGALALVRVMNCVVRGFASFGIDVQGGVTIDRCAVIDNVNAIGVRFSNGFPLGPMHSTITNSTVQGNASGVVVREFTAAVVKDSLLTGNGVGAAAFSDIDGNTAEVMLENCTVAHNTAVGIQLAATGSNVLARAYLSLNVIAYNPQGVAAGLNSSVVSFLNNRFVGNATDGDPFSSTAFK